MISRLQILFIVLSMLTWLIGANVLTARHHRRLGESPGSSFRPFAFPFANFNAKEWRQLAALAFASISLGMIGLW